MKARELPAIPIESDPHKTYGQCSRTDTVRIATRASMSVAYPRSSPVEVADRGRHHAGIGHLAS